MEDLRLPPSAVEAEQSILGSMMLDNRKIDDVVLMISPEDFYRQDHSEIFAAIRDLSQSGQPCDAVTVSDRLDELGKLDELGGLSAIGSMARNTPTAANIKSYCKIVKEKSIKRKIIEIANDAIESIYEDKDMKSEGVLDQIDNSITSLMERSTSGQARHISDEMRKEIEALDKRSRSKSSMVGIPSGIAPLDAMMKGFEGGNSYVLAARPSMGKTAFMMNIWSNIGIEEGKKALFLSLEMPASQLVQRLMSALGRVDLTGIRDGNLTSEDWPRITNSVSLMKESGLYVEDLPSLSVPKVRAIARNMQKKHGLDFICLDYLQLMGSENMTQNRTQEVTKFSNGLKAIAKELDVPVLILSQLSRSLESRADKRPVMSDLRESGAIEQDADVIMFLYRDEYYYKEASPFKDMAELIVAKQRNGPLGTIPLKWKGSHQRFEAMSDFEQADFFNKKQNQNQSSFGNRSLG